jgi:hypothetical protein
VPPDEAVARTGRRGLPTVTVFGSERVDLWAVTTGDVAGTVPPPPQIVAVVDPAASLR